MDILKEIEANLESEVRFLSEEIGPRSYRDLKKLNKTADRIEEKMISIGCKVNRQTFKYMGNSYHNIIGELKGKKDSEIIVLGAHYDTVPYTPGADDNASGIAGLLELARLSTIETPSKTIYFVAFTLEEPPFFRTRHMGSYMYAESLWKKNIRIEGMISLEMIGYYCDKKGCQYYPLHFFKWFYPEKGDFIAFVGNLSSKAFTKKIKTAFQMSCNFPVESLNTISLIPGIDFSDHSSFWDFGYPAFMITDTAFYRNPHYHTPGDEADTLNFKKMALLIYGLKSAISL